ncbi:hypothetical protein L195_g051619, partial [Trifolium pratense]
MITESMVRDERFDPVFKSKFFLTKGGQAASPVEHNDDGRS